jgi:hypothetical protein
VAHHHAYSNSLHQKKNGDASYMCLSSTILKQAVPATVVSNKNIIQIPLEDIQHHTDVPDKLTACSSDVFQFSMA